MVFYRQYRPQTIEELDTLWVRENLGAVLSSGKIPHAFLFTGPRGLGKTSAARIVAKSVNCLKGKNGAICGQCSSCVAISQGTSLDVLEIDAASNRGIDEIRDLREKIKFSPTSSRYKVYIIDEVHMLTPEAFNALLKTLEEPPAHAIFVLCTTEAQKLPPTIISRCLRFDFKRASRDDLVRSLQRIVKGEKIKIEEEVLEEIGQGADGSFRDAAKILEQAVLSGRKITKDQIKKMLGETENLKPEKLLALLAQKDARGAVMEINKLTEAGENLRVYNEKILSLLHQILMAKVGVSEEKEKNEMATLFAKEDILRLVELFSRSYQELKTAVVPQLPLELAAVEYCSDGLAADVTHDDTLRPPDKSSVSSTTPPPSNPVANEISQLWPQIIEATKEYNHTLAGVLRGCRPQNFDGKILTIETLYQFHKDKLNEPKTRELLGKALGRFLGGEVVFECVLSQRLPVNRKDGEKNV